MACRPSCGAACGLWLGYTCVTLEQLKPEQLKPERLRIMLLPRLRALFSMDTQPEGPRLRVVNKQNQLFRTGTKSPMLSDLRLEVEAKRFGDPPTTITGAELQPILMTCAGRLFVQREFARSLPKEEAGPVAHVLNDMFHGVAGLRGVNTAFYIASLDIWPALQEEFVKSMAAFIKTKPVMTLRMPVDCVAEIMRVLDPSLSRQWDDESKRWIGVLNQDAAANALRLTFHEKLKRHLRYHSAIQLMMLFSNDITIIENGDVLKRLDMTVPTLSGFAAYLDMSFGFFISRAIKDDSRNETISLFYESEAPAWNMLPDEHGTKNLQEYLDSISVTEGKLSKLVPAPADIFAGAWPRLPEIDSLDTYIFGGEEQCMPPIRKVTVELRVSEWVPRVRLEMIAEIILPMRLLLSSTFDVDTGRTIWSPQFDSYAINVTTDILAQCTWLSEMPAGFEVTDHHISTISAQYQHLAANSPLTAHQFAIWADVMLTYDAHNGEPGSPNPGDPFRKRMEELPLFRNFVLVANGIKDILPAFHRDIYVDGNVSSGDSPYENSPINKDWGATSWVEVDTDEWQLQLDPEFRDQFDQRSPSSRKSWTTTSFFDMSLSFMKQNRGLNAGVFSPTTVWGLTLLGIRDTIWNERLCAEDIAPLMKHAALWSRHTFTQAEGVVARQHALLAQANPPAVAQAPRRLSGRPRGQLISINQISLERRRAGFLQ